MTKQQSRKMFRQIWDGISQRELEKISSQVCHHIAASSEWKHAETVLAYLSFGKEISLDELIQKSLEEQKTLGVPLIEGSTRMSFRKLDSWPSRGFEINKWGIREPGKTYPVLSPGKNTLILVPGLGFSSDGKRMGRGGGFYDRYLEKADLRESVLMGITCDACLNENIPTKSHDRKVSMICTESGIIHP